MCKRVSVSTLLGITVVALLATMLLLATSGCASRYEVGMVRDDSRAGDKALWRYQKEQDERIQLLERRVYHLERGELLDHPAKEAK